MPPCSCSVRALEVFVKEVVGVSLRRVRPRIPLQRQRRFGTSPPFRQLETDILGPTDDTRIPFRLDHERPTLLQKVQDSSKTSEPRSNAKSRDLDRLEDEWHAEIRIASLWPQVTGSGRADDSARMPNQQESSMDSDAEENSKDVSGSVDSGSLHGLHARGTESRDDATVSLAPSKQAQVSQQSRAGSRLGRKSRRIEAGKHNRMREESQGGKRSAQDQVQTVLEKIQALEGPGLISRRKARIPVKTRLEQKETKTTPKARAQQNVISKPDISRPKVNREDWQVQKQALERKFGQDGWQPRKRLSPDTLEGIRALHNSDSSSYTTATLAEHFQVTPEAIRRILKSKWRPNTEEIEDRRVRWEKRGMRKWEDMAEQGMRPPAKWRALGISHVEEYPDGNPKQGKNRGYQDDKYVRWDDLARDSRKDDVSSSLAERIL